MNIVNSIRSLALALSALALVCGNATAGDRNAQEQRIVRYSDLNLNHPDGVKVLYRRLTSAARAVCPVQLSVSAAARYKATQCAQMALANAIAKIDNANLTAYHDAKSDKQSMQNAKVASRR